MTDLLRKRKIASGGVGRVQSGDFGGAGDGELRLAGGVRRLCVEHPATPAFGQQAKSGEQAGQKAEADCGAEDKDCQTSDA